MKFFLKCHEAASVCDRTQYCEASFFDKLSLKLHLVLCKLCRSYAKRNKKLTKTLDAANIKTLEPADKQKLKNELAVLIKKETSIKANRKR